MDAPQPLPIDATLLRLHSHEEEDWLLGMAYTPQLLKCRCEDKSTLLRKVQVVR